VSVHTRELQARWTSELERIGRDDSWVGQALRPVIAAASAVPQLQALFPFTSVNRLCFSRCSDYPYTVDCPCIAATKASEYIVQARWTVSDEPPPELLFTTDLDRALTTVVENLPPNPYAWLGDRDQQPR
jgi:hypothetical protein